MESAAELRGNRGVRMTRRLWIAVERHVVSRDIIGHAAEVLGRTRAHVLGHMVAMWGEVAEDAKMGDVSDVRPATIEHWAQWDGEPGVFAAFVLEHCVTDGVISGWDEMQGRFEREKRADAERKAASRKRPVDVRKKSGGHPGKSTVTVHNKTVQDSSTTASPAAVQKKRDSWYAVVAETYEATNGAGSFQYGKHTAMLKPLKDAGHAPEDVATKLAVYLKKLDSPRYTSLPKFVETYATWVVEPLYDIARDGPPVDEFGVESERMNLLTCPNRRQERIRLGLPA